MAITLHLPSTPLSAYLERMWYWEGPAPYPRMTVLPMPALHLMVNFGDPYHVYGSAADGGGPCATCGASWAIGLRDMCHVMEWPRDLRILSVSFKPGGAYPFLQFPLAELRNQLVPLEAIWGYSATQIRERLAAAPTPQTRLALLERLLLAHLARLGEAPRGPDAGLDIARHALAEIARQRGALSIGALSARLGVSHKHLIAQFTQLVGGTPKAVARAYRLQGVLESVEAGVDQVTARPLGWARIAHHAGYFDEAHFNKDFRVFTGHTPSDYVRVLRRARAEHPAFGLYPRFLPAG